MLVVSDERGGGLSNTECNTGPGGVIGGLHFFALAPVNGIAATKTASPSNPVKIGDFFIPNPLLAYDPLQAVLDSTSPRTERACTAHVFRLGGNGSNDARPDPERLRRRLAAEQAPHVGGVVRRGRLADRLLGPAEQHGRRRGGSADDVGQHARVERDARRRHVVGEGVQGPHLRRRHAARLRRLRLRELHGARVHVAAGVTFEENPAETALSTRSSAAGVSARPALCSCA